MLFVIIKCEIFPESSKKKIGFLDILASLLISLKLNVALMTQIKYLVTLYVSKNDILY